MAAEERSGAIRGLGFLDAGQLSPGIVRNLVARVSRRVAVPCRIVRDITAGRLPLLESGRQADADRLLDRLEKLARDDEILVGITGQDIGSRIFSFYFGRARLHGRALVVSTARLHPSFYGLPEDPALTMRRATLEVLHEIGHVAGLQHCSDYTCVMHFAATVEAIDLRGTDYCRACSELLPSGLIER